MNTATYQGITFTDKDVVNPDDYSAYNSHYRVKPYLIHDQGIALAVVFERNEQDVLDTAADEGKLDNYLIDINKEGVIDEYMIKDVVTPGYDEKVPEYVDPDGNKYWWREGYEPTFLGNASEPFDIETLGILELPNPPFSFVALFNAHTKGEKEC